MPEPTVGLDVAVIRVVVRVVFGAIVVHKLDYTFTVCEVGAVGGGGGAVVGEEIDTEFLGGEVDFLEEGEAEEAVELDWTGVALVSMCAKP